MRGKTILLDCDGVVADFVSPLLEHLNTRDTRSRVLTLDDVREWDLHHLPEFDDTAQRYINSEGYAYSLPVIAGSQDAVEAMRREDARVLFVTAPNSQSKTWCWERLEWLKKHFRVGKDEVVFAWEKSHVYGHYLVDDKASNLSSWHSRWYELEHFQAKPLVFSQPWNLRQDKPFGRIPGWDSDREWLRAFASGLL